MGTPDEKIGLRVEGLWLKICGVRGSVAGGDSRSEVSGFEVATNPHGNAKSTNLRFDVSLATGRI